MVLSCTGDPHGLVDVSGTVGHIHPQAALGSLPGGANAFQPPRNYSSTLKFPLGTSYRERSSLVRKPQRSAWSCT